MAEAPEYSFPESVSFEEKGDVLEVELVISALKTRIGFHRSPSNATVEHEFGDRSVWITAAVRDKKDNVTNYRYMVKRLPHEIVSKECSIKYRDKLIVLKLKKADPDRVWDLLIQQNQGLETDGQQEI